MSLTRNAISANNGWDVSLTWRRSLFDWKKVQVRQLLEVVHDLCVVLEKVDRWVWKVDMFKEFSINLAYGILRGVLEGDESRIVNLFWRIKVLPSAQVTAWRMLENLILRLIYINTGLRLEMFCAASLWLKKRS
ncbi:uncharacterized protein [Phaseolus vulgaris]|uniref:uncharacterized protein n=1 Tax=Phaseolus vulgaris TaxID=3885 RepID=UPI0035CB63A7